MQNEAAIVGVGATPYYYRGTSQPQTTYELIGKAVIAAVKDAGLAIDDIDGLAFFAGGYEPGYLTEQLGIPEITFAATVSAQGGGSAGILDLAAMAIQTGRAKTVLCIGASQQSNHRYGLTLNNLSSTPDSIYSKLARLPGPGHAFALSARRHMHRYGTRREAFGEVVIASRMAARTRDTALRRKPLSLDEYMAAPMLADPLCRYDFCLETDGALAFVVTSTERAKDLPNRPVYIAASAMVGSREWGRSFFWLNQPDDVFVTAGAGATAKRLYELAGLAPKDIDVALIYDHFSPLVITQLEDYGFCKPGEGGPFVESGAIRLDGALPVNPHGGHLSEGYVPGMTHIREAVEQLRGTAINQVSEARFALVTGGPAPIPMSGAILRN